MLGPSPCRQSESRAASKHKPSALHVLQPWFYSLSALSCRMSSDCTGKTCHARMMSLYELRVALHNAMSRPGSYRRPKPSRGNGLSE